MIIGPTPWWQLSLISTCPAGTTLPDGSRIICKSGGGCAWIVAPNCTQVSQTWNGTTTCSVGNKPCVSDWPTLNTALLNNGFNPCDWFVPSSAQLVNPGYCCRTQWDPSTCYWSSTESSATGACLVCFTIGATNVGSKANASCVRAFRCVTY
jgi:hypothetical protein